MSVRKMKIDHHTFEGPCDCCGCPLYVGDMSFVNMDTEEVFCSRRCANSSNWTEDTVRDPDNVPGVLGR